MKTFATQYPTTFAVVVTLALEIVLLACLLAARVFAPQLPVTALDLPIMLINCLFAAALLTTLGWWRAAGFNAPNKWRDLHLLIIPVVLLLIPALLVPLQWPAAGSLVALAVVTFLIGFQEEAIYRGVILHALRPKGAVYAAALSALLFGVIHANSLLVGRDPLFVASQVVASLFGGFGLAALRLRINTIWPLIVLHMFNDFLQFTATNGIEATNVPLYIPVAKIVLSLAMGLYGWYLLRAARESERLQAVGNESVAV